MLVWSCCRLLLVFCLRRTWPRLNSKSVGFSFLGIQWDSWQLCVGFTGIHGGNTGTHGPQDVTFVDHSTFSLWIMFKLRKPQAVALHGRLKTRANMPLVSGRGTEFR